MGRPGVIQRRDVSVTDTIESNVGILGDIRYEVGTAGGGWYQCVQAGTTLSEGQPYQANSLSVATGNDAYSVGVNHLLSAPANGVYNAQTLSIAASAFFWGQYAGKGVVLNDDGATLASRLGCKASDSGVVLISGAESNALEMVNFRSISSVAATGTAVMHIFCEQI